MPLPGGYLLDTNVLVHLLRNNDLGQFLDATYHLLTPPSPLPVSIVTVGELYALANKFNWGAAKRMALDKLLACLVWVDINDPQLLLAYKEIDAWSQANGYKMGKNDVWIAATSRRTNTTVLTCDKDFDHLHGVWIDREWVDPASKLPTP